MLVREGRRGAIEAGLRMRDELHRDFRHHPFEPTLGDEAMRETGPRQMILEPEPQSARNHHPTGALCKRNVARDSAKRQAEAIERGCGQAVAAFQCSRPQRLVIDRRDRAILKDRERAIDIVEARAGRGCADA